MAWEKDESGNIAIDDNGNPIWGNDAGEKKGVDYSAMSKSLTDTTRESVDRKNKLRALESKYAKLADIEDLDAWHAEATKALEMMKNAPDKDKEIEERITARVKGATDPLNAKLADIAKQRDTLEAELQREAIGNAFARSEYARKNLVDPALAADLFSKRFVRKEGRVMGLDESGAEMCGESGIATFDEALRQMVEFSPYKGVLLKGSEASGGGANPTPGRVPSSAKHMRRADFEKLDPASRTARMREGYTLTD